MTSEIGIHSGKSTIAVERESSLKETDEEMVVAKPTVEYEGYQRTITDVVRIRREEEEDDPTGISQLMVGIDDAIKVCRNLRGRLAGLHSRRNKGLYRKINPKPLPSE